MIIIDFKNYFLEYFLIIEHNTIKTKYITIHLIILHKQLFIFT